MEVIGIDIGFGFTKATSGKRSLIFKSVFGDAADIQFREHFIEHSHPDQHLHIELDGKAYFVGELAERQSNVRSFTLDQNQFVSKFARVLALVALAPLVERNAPVKLITGLPVSYYRRHRDELSGVLQGKHTVTLLDPGGERRETVINVTQVRVIPQPFGSFFNAMLNDAAEIADKRFLTGKIGVIDVGFRTSDYAIADRTRYSERGSATSDSGIAKAFSIIATKLKEKSGVNVELYRLYDAVERGVIKIRGKTYDVKNLTDQVLGQLASSIAAEIERLWADDWDIDLMIITGGGGGLLMPYLKPLLNGEVIGNDPAKDYRVNNVRGYWKYARHLWARESKPDAPA